MAYRASLPKVSNELGIIRVRFHRDELRNKACGPCMVMLLNWRPIYEWYMVKNGHQKDTWYDESGLCAQNDDASYRSIVNLIGRVFVIVETKSESSISLL